MGKTKKYYAIRKGRKTGIFDQPWSIVVKYVDKYPNAEYKGFHTFEEAEKYISNNLKSNKKTTHIRNKKVHVQESNLASIISSNKEPVQKIEGNTNPSKKIEKDIRKRKREKQRNVEELKAMNNEIEMTDKQRKMRMKHEKKSKPTIVRLKRGISEKSYQRYNQTVWKGWRETDDVNYPVTGSGGKKKIKKK